MLAGDTLNRSSFPGFGIYKECLQNPTLGSGEAGDQQGDVKGSDEIVQTSTMSGGRKVFPH